MNLAADELLPRLVGKSPEVIEPGRIGLPKPVEYLVALHV